MLMVKSRIGISNIQLIIIARLILKAISVGVQHFLSSREPAATNRNCKDKGRVSVVSVRNMAWIFK